MSRTVRSGCESVRPWSWCFAGLFAVLLCCGPTPQPDRVRLRLGAEHFGFDTKGTRGPSAVIGDELRPVIAGVESIPIFEAREVAAEANALELAVVLPDDAVDLPDSSFIVSALQLEDTDVGMVARWQELAGTNWIRLDDGWTLDRDASGRGVLHVAAGALEGRGLLRLSVVHTPPRTLQSHSFDVAAGATLELGYGLLDPEYGVPGSSTEFTASLACDNADFGVVHRSRIDHVAENANWNDARVRLPQSSHSCRLRLISRTRGDESVAAVWSLPRIVGPPSGNEKLRNLVLISIDTLRADRLSGYGYARNTSPVIDRELVARGTRFADLTTTYPRTDVAHLGMFTGLYRSAFGSPWSRLATNSPIQTMTEKFAAAGIETVAFTEGVLMSRRQGFWYGFDRFAEQHDGTGRARETFEQGIGFLERARDKQFFLFLHTYQTHKPYQPAPEYAKLYDQADDTGPHRLVPAEHRGASTDYDREIRQTDALLEEFFDRLDSIGLSATTYVAVISDHGEAFGEHHFLFHGRSAYQEELHIPFVIRGPGIPAGRVIDEPVSLVDVAPTLLDLLNAPRLAQSQGRSLAAALLENAPIASEPVFFEWIGRGNPRGVRHGHFKVLQRNRKNPHLIVYDLETDPAERRPIEGPHSARERGRELLEAHEEEGASLAAALAPTRAEPRVEPVPRDLREELRALGYVE